jgi:hypothetical protein
MTSLQKGKIHRGDTENRENFSVLFTQILCELCVSVVFAVDSTIQ